MEHPRPALADEEHAALPMKGRRVATLGDIDKPGDYCGPIEGYSGPGVSSVFFLLPNDRYGIDPNVPRRGSLHHVVTPPHIFRECADGSLEIRESIGAEPLWHGYLDEGHIWRGVGEWA